MQPLFSAEMEPQKMGGKSREDSLNWHPGATFTVQQGHTGDTRVSGFQPRREDVKPNEVNPQRDTVEEINAAGAVEGGDR